MTTPKPSPEGKKRVVLTKIDQRHRKILDLTMRLLDISNEEMAKLLADHAAGGYRTPKGESLRQRRAGIARVSPTDVEDVTTVLDLPNDFFRMDPLDAGHWLLVNRSEQVIRPSTWIDATLVPA